MRYGLRVLPEGVEHPSAEQVMAATRDAGFGDEVKRRIILGTYALSSGYYDAYYGQAQKVRTLIARDFAAAFEQADVLVSPTAPTTAFKLGEQARRPAGDVPQRPRHHPGQPRRRAAACRCPSGLADEDGLPVGFQILAPALADDRLYRVGAALEALLLDAVGRPAARPGARRWQAAPMTRRRAERRPVAFDDALARFDPVARARGARRAQHRDQDVLRLPDRVRRRAQHPGLPDLPRPARRAAGGQRARRSSRRSGSAWR